MTESEPGEAGAGAAGSDAADVGETAAETPGSGDTAPGADLIHCPPAGKRVRVVETAAETGGEYVRFEMFLDPDSHGPYLHVHPIQDERLEVASGRIGVVVDGVEHVLDAGEHIDIPRGAEHKFWNESDEETRLFGELRPGRRTDEFLPLAFALARDRVATKAGVPLNPLAVAAVFDEYPDYYYFAYVPVSLQRFGIRLLAPVARALGYESRPADVVPSNVDSED